MDRWVDQPDDSWRREPQLQYHQAEQQDGQVRLRDAAEWCSNRPGHPTSYALVGVHDGPDTASHARTGEAFHEALIGRADDVLFGLPVEYQGAVDDVLAVCHHLLPSVAAHALLVPRLSPSGH